MMNIKCSLLAIGCWLLATSPSFAQNWEADFLRNTNTNRNKNYDNALIKITDSVYPLAVATPLSTLAIGLIKKDKALTNKGLQMSVAIVGAMGASTVLKYTVNRVRPYETHRFLVPLHLENDPSFPSGHTTAAFATATNLSLAFPKWYVYVPAYAWAGTVGYSRMHMGVHYPTDVLAGATIGICSGLITRKANQWLQKKRK